MGVFGSLSDLQRELEVLHKVSPRIPRPLHPSPVGVNTASLFQAHFQELDQLFYGTGSSSVSHEPEAKPEESAPAAGRNGVSSVTPQQTKKRPKRLSSLAEDKDEPHGEYLPVGRDADTSANPLNSLANSASTANSSARQSARVNNTQLLAVAEDSLNTTASLMPPPPAPAGADTTISSGRPQRAAKLKSEKMLKEPSLVRKMRRPSNEESIRVKVESEQRASQFHSSTSGLDTLEKQQEQLELQSEQAPALPAAEEPDQPAEGINTSKTLRVKIKREKMSNESLAPATEATASSTATLESTVETARPDETVATNTTATNTTATTEPGKKGRKKKKDNAECHRPIKIERFSDLDKGSPVSSRTRKCSTESRTNQEHSIYKDALEGPPAAAAAPAAGNETVTHNNVTMVLGPAPTSDDSPRGPAGDATFEVHKSDKKAPAKQDSLLTEDESVEDKLPVSKTLSGIKAMKLPARTHELFK